jgi:hypothetical protein
MVPGVPGVPGMAFPVPPPTVGVGVGLAAVPTGSTAAALGLRPSVRPRSMTAAVPGTPGVAVVGGPFGGPMLVATPAPTPRCAFTTTGGYVVQL